MQAIDESKVQARFSNGGHPQAIELICPHCTKPVTFTPKSWHEPERPIAVTDVPCPRCGGSVLFLRLLDLPGAQATHGLYAHPAPVNREGMPGLEHLRSLSAPLGRTYESALKLYNQADWGPAALTLRHLLEGLVTHLLGEDKRGLPLPRQLEALPDEADLAKPLQDIAQLLGPGGTFERQLEDEAGIEKVGAEQLLELVEQLITYLVVLPGTMAELKRRIATAPVPIRRGNSAA